jgi:hypothetical protein
MSFQGPLSPLPHRLGRWHVNSPCVDVAVADLSPHAQPEASPGEASRPTPFLYVDLADGSLRVGLGPELLADCAHQALEACPVQLSRRRALCHATLR